MAPPTPIQSREEVLRGKKCLTMVDNKKGKCTLTSITQFQCRFENSYEGEYICLPFKRLFEECSGIRIEVTDRFTNNDK
ncbi:hypothetical protein Kpol_1032p3 [Vanderwaltozyma polyspora DSM 70294]|uniref:Uncharacterized protein n=1 Tax=Vanderwaltozyma polyspora (strain ATCC 22028 / DSM 70294 / BCRC 21397 / CBS 2163 / NBRC 10782 / NRRL Y-8283 / UCD 57-17) TaxID=436907 RepID=A7TGV9_VANPO|nr:uncharacterized protein Kpol_1032p3 [Vanderwaltozyma polyspora DSM 70294]EDO18411.1 hypothetical protein Kpol_1032p3 [Vanderwaltozyma polyspora DSM 70294]